MTEAEYGDLHRVVWDEIQGAIKVFHTHAEIHIFTAESEANDSKMQEHAEFWRTSSHCLLAVLFLKLGKIFDEGKRSHSVTRFLASVVAHPEFFSRKAFTARVAKRMNGGPVPDWVSHVSEPSSSDLRLLKDAVKPHADRYRKIYKPIRDKYFAHNDALLDQELAALFAKTNKEEMGETLCCLYSTMRALQELYQDGKDLSFEDAKVQNHPAYGNKIRVIREKTRAVLAAL